MEHKPSRPIPRGVTELEETQLVAAVAGGEDEALTRLYQRYGKLVRAEALRVVRDASQAEDVVQDCFLKVWSNAARFDPRRGSLRAWLLSSVRHRAIDYLRGRHAHERQERELPADAPARGLGADPWQEVASSMERAALRQALASLPPEQAEALQLAYLCGYRHAEIARMQRVPLSTVKGRIRVGLKKLEVCPEARSAVRPRALEEEVSAAP
jgi:RNA polymerase sigma factor (sigma-70 family)